MSEVADKPKPRHVPASILQNGKVPDAIPIRLVIFQKPARQVPGNTFTENINTGQKTGDKWTVTYFPRLMIFEIMREPVDQRQKVDHGFVPLSVVEAFWPADL